MWAEILEGKFDNKIWPTKYLKLYETEILQIEQDIGFGIRSHFMTIC